MAKIKELMKVEDLTTCESTAQMITKARKDGVELFFDRANEMKACPIGAQSACCKHCSMGPCRMNVSSPYDRVGICGATIDTIVARNFGRMVAAGTAAHTDHGMAMLELFRDVINGKNTDFKIQDPMKLMEVAKSLDIVTEGRELKRDCPRSLCRTGEDLYPGRRRDPDDEKGSAQDPRAVAQGRDRAARGHAGDHGDDAQDRHRRRSGL